MTTSTIMMMRDVIVCLLVIEEEEDELTRTEPSLYSLMMVSLRLLSWFPMSMKIKVTYEINNNSRSGQGDVCVVGCSKESEEDMDARAGHSMNEG